MPEPITRPAGSPEISRVIWVIMSTGFEATSRIASGQTRMISPITSRNTAALRPSRSTRVSPGRCATPGSDDDHLGAAKAVVVPAQERGAEGERHGMGDVERLRLGQRRVQVDQHDLARHAAHAEGVRRGAADHAASDDPDLHARSPLPPGPGEKSRPLSRNRPVPIRDPGSQNLESGPSRTHSVAGAPLASVFPQDSAEPVAEQFTVTALTA